MSSAEACASAAGTVHAAAGALARRIRIGRVGAGRFTPPPTCPFVTWKRSRGAPEPFTPRAGIRCVESSASNQPRRIKRAGTASGAHIRQVADDAAGPCARAGWRRRRRGGSAGCDPARTVVAAAT
jgi:hypothetical protein